MRFFLLALASAGCGVVSTRLQPHDTVVATNFTLPGVACPNQPIVFDASFERSPYLSSAGLDPKTSCVKSAALELTVALSALGAGRDCERHGIVTLSSILLSYDYETNDGATSGSQEYACPASTQQLDLGGDPQRLVDSLNICLSQVGIDKDTAKQALNRKPVRLRFFGKGDCAVDTCGSLDLNVSLVMREITQSVGEECK